MHQYFNPIIVLFLTHKRNSDPYVAQFQSYYSLIFNWKFLNFCIPVLGDFNPIIVLFLTEVPKKGASGPKFQSYYSLIFN